MAGQAKGRSATRMVTWLGIASGMLAIIAVLVTSSAAGANAASIASLQHDVFGLFQGGGADPTPELLTLAPALVATYLSILLCGAAMLGICWYAGRLTVWHGYGVAASEIGLRIALLSSLIWGMASIAAVLITHGDASITGVFTSYTISRLGLELGGLLVQELLFTLIGMALGAYCSSLGARSVSPRVPGWPPLSQYPPQPAPPQTTQPLPPR